MNDDTPFPGNSSWHRLAQVTLTVALVASLVLGAAGPASAQAQQAQPGTIVALHDDGSANVTIVLTYDLTGDTERHAFDLLSENDGTVSDIRARFESRMTDVVASASNTTGREMTVTNTSVSLSTSEDGETGIVRLVASVENLSAHEDGTLVLTEPFASGFYADRPVRVLLPDGYSVTSVSPDPDARDGTTLTWEAGTEFDGFELVVGPSDGTSSPDAGAEVTTTNTPGFGIAIAAVALLAGALLALRHRNR
jgi:PGF-CTERM protein